MNGCQTVCSATLNALAGIGNYVWEDIDHDGQQDDFEPAIPNVTVHLKNAAGVIIATTTTDANGEYYFLSLPAGTYSVQFVIPEGMDYTASNTGNDALDSDIVLGMMGMTGTYTLDPGELDFTVDAGLFVRTRMVLSLTLVLV
ncbi:MAG: SdrD B-like domain-containing protein [Saprospiraceae bacterium]